MTMGTRLALQKGFVNSVLPVFFAALAAHCFVAEARPVTGAVLSQSTGEPISNALVRVSAPAVDMRKIDRPTSKASTTIDARTDANGQFSIDVPDAEAISLDAFAPGYQSAAGTYMSGGQWNLHAVPFKSHDVSKFTIRLSPSLYVAGKVVDEAGRPLVGIQVCATIRFPDSYGYIGYTRSDDEGRFEIFDFPIESNGARGELEFQDPKNLRSVVENVYTLSDAARREIRLIMNSGHAIRGRVTSVDGLPASNLSIEAIPSDTHEEFKRTSTDAEGRYVLSGLPSGEITVRAVSFRSNAKAEKSVRIDGADVAADLSMGAIVLDMPPEEFHLFGMKLVDVTADMARQYSLSKSEGILILDAGPNSEQLNIGPLEAGRHFWMIGEKNVGNLREMLAEILRINDLLISVSPNEGSREHVRVVHSDSHSSYTGWLDVTGRRLAEVKSLQAMLSLEKTP